MSKASHSQRALPLLLSEQLHKLGRSVAVARKRRRISLDSMAERMMVSRSTVQRLEKGDATISLGILATALWVLGLHTRISDLMPPEKDLIGIQEDIRHLPRAVRKRTSKKAQKADDDLDF
ncbi:MAG: helix-turn-helix transcriptional regulator [Bdellovibrionales bacterium]|jgi:transcriptional regulator with XRE-family HTH domain